MKKINDLFSLQVCRTLAFINFVFAVFIDSIFIYKFPEIHGLESILYAGITNIAFVVFLILSIKKGEKLKINFVEMLTNHYPLFILMAIVAVLAITQFDITAVYDAHLYYGSFIESIKLTKIEIVNDFGAFINWGHEFIGTSLFLVPFELLAFGRMYGSYAMNTILMLVTMVVLYKYLQSAILKTNRWFITFAVAVFVFMPYSFNLITYFCPDYYLELYLVWLLYAYKKDNQILISFIGFLMCTTKDSGAFLYGFFVLFAYIFDCLYQFKTTRYKFWKIKNIPFVKFALWLIPAFVYALIFLFREKIQLQVFASAGELTFGLQSFDVTIQALQNLVFGFRWVISIFATIALIVYFFKKIGKKNEHYLESNYFSAFLSLIASNFMLHVLFSVFTLSHCPRYNSPFNVLLTIAFVLSLSILFRKEIIKTIISLACALLMFVQVFFTIDPAIIKTCSSLDVGNNLIYNVACIKNRDAGLFADCNGDFFVYNEEYAVHTKLVDQALTYINPQSEADIRILDTYIYDFHFGGLQYYIYWDTKVNKQVYEENENTIIIHDSTVSTLEPVGEYPGYSLILIVPGRRNTSVAINRYIDAGYRLIDSHVVLNSNGYLTVLQFAYNE